MSVKTYINQLQEQLLATLRFPVAALSNTQAQVYLRPLLACDLYSVAIIDKESHYVSWTGQAFARYAGQTHLDRGAYKQQDNKQRLCVTFSPYDLAFVLEKVPAKVNEHNLLVELNNLKNCGNTQEISQEQCLWYKERLQIAADEISQTIQDFIQLYTKQISEEYTVVTTLPILQLREYEIKRNKRWGEISTSFKEKLLDSPELAELASKGALSQLSINTSEEKSARSIVVNNEESIDFRIMTIICREWNLDRKLVYQMQTIQDSQWLEFYKEYVVPYAELLKACLDQKIDFKALLQQQCLPRLSSIEPSFSNEQIREGIAQLESGQILAYFCCNVQFEVLNIDNITVNQEVRGCGFGKLLMQIMFALGEVKEVENYLLEVRKSNHQALNLYQQQQFKVIGTRKNYYATSANQLPEDALIMQYLKETIKGIE